jgi:hypothetical protein
MPDDLRLAGRRWRGPAAPFRLAIETDMGAHDHRPLDGRVVPPNEADVAAQHGTAARRTNW